MNSDLITSYIKPSKRNIIIPVFVAVFVSIFMGFHGFLYYYHDLLEKDITQSLLLVLVVELIIYTSVIVAVLSNYSYRTANILRFLFAFIGILAPIGHAYDDLQSHNVKVKTEVVAPTKPTLSTEVETLESKIKSLENNNKAHAEIKTTYLDRGEMWGAEKKQKAIDQNIEEINNIRGEIQEFQQTYQEALATYNEALRKQQTAVNTESSASNKQILKFWFFVLLFFFLQGAGIYYTNASAFILLSMHEARKAEVARELAEQEKKKELEEDTGEEPEEMESFEEAAPDYDFNEVDKDEPSLSELMGGQGPGTPLDLNLQEGNLQEVPVSGVGLEQEGEKVPQRFATLDEIDTDPLSLNHSESIKSSEELTSSIQNLHNILYSQRTFQVPEAAIESFVEESGITSLEALTEAYHTSAIDNVLQRIFPTQIQGAFYELIQKVIDPLNPVTPRVTRAQESGESA